jgi:hypothetical protein
MGQCENLAAGDQNLFFLGFMGGYFEFIGALDTDFDDLGGMVTLIGGLAGLYYLP